MSWEDIFWKSQAYQCFAPIDPGYRYWPPYVLPFIIWGSFLLLVLISYGLMKCFNCLGHCQWSQHFTNWLVFMFAVNGSLWFWIIYILYFKISCEGQHHGGLPGFVGYEDAALALSWVYFLFVIFIVLALIVITIYDMVTMEERKMIQKWVSPEDASEYLMGLKDSAPRQRVLVEVYHEEDHRPRFGRIEGRQDHMRSRHFRGTIDMGEVVKEKVVTFTEDRDFDYDTWEDPTNYPDIQALLERNLFVKFHINVIVEPGDSTTQSILDSFKRRLVASCAYRDQRVNEEVQGIVSGMKFTKLVVKRTENISEARNPIASCAGLFCFSSCGLWLACLFSVGAIVRVLLRMQIRRISLNIKKKYYADPANVRSYDFEDSLPGGQANAFGGSPGASLLPGHTASRNPSPVPTAPVPTHDNKDHYLDTDRQPEYWGEKSPPSYEDSVS